VNPGRVCAIRGGLRQATPSAFLLDIPVLLATFGMTRPGKPCRRPAHPQRSVEMAEEMVEIRWHARGGQGAKTAAIFVAEAVLDKGKFGQGFPEYGPERRGAPMRGYTRISSQPIRLHCSIESPDIVIVLDPTLLDAPAAGVTAGVKPETIFLVNTSEKAADIRKRLKLDGAKVYTVDATQIALDCFGKSIPNMPMIGALLAVVELMSIQELQDALISRFQKKFSQAVIDGNLAAVARAHKELVSA
jgi:pyruvate ferredoxin oxidoreductase gamma subunit